MNSDPLDLAAQERLREEKKLRDKLARENEIADVKWLMGSKRGRRIVWRTLEQAGVFQLSFNTDALKMAFAEGNRNFGNRMLRLVHAHAPEQFVLMLEENRSDVRPE